MPKEITTDVCILGAGPGGATTAMFLAQKGIRSILVDKAAFPRDKICGDALSGKVINTLNKLNPALVNRLNIEPIQVGSWGVKFIAPNMKELRVPFKTPNKNEVAPGNIAKRLHFDNFLYNETKKHNLIDRLECVELTDFEFEKKHLTCRSKSGDIVIKTKLLIAANGAHSRFAKKYGGIKVEPKHYCAGVRGYFENVTDLDENNFIELFFLKELLPGYLWIFPLPNGTANVGIGVRSDVVSKKKLNLRKLLPEIINRYPSLKKRFSHAKKDGQIQGFGLPMGSKKRSISGERYMLVGDAASLIDPFTGEGIGNAMISGMLAAQQAEKCIDANDFGEKLMKQYDESVYGRMWSELSLSKRMQQLVQVPWLFNAVVNKATTSKTLRETISCMFEDMDIRKRLKQPSFYINLLLSK